MSHKAAFFPPFSLLLLLALLVAVSGCDLESELKGEASPDNFFTDANSAEAALSGVYRAVLSGKHGYQRQHWGMTDTNSDDQIYATESRPGYFEAERMAVTPANSNSTSFWQGNWRGINRANFVINRVSQMENIDSETQEQLINEARFLRAFIYFHLVQLYGPLPTKTSETSSDPSSQTTGPRVSVQEVYDQVIIPDLQAAENLPVEPEAPGRAGKGAAKTLLAKVFLTMAGEPLNNEARYQDALQKAQEVVDLGIYELFPDYADAFRVETENGIEHIFSGQYQSGNDFFDHNIGGFFLPLSCPDGGFDGQSHPTMDLVNFYLDQEGESERYQWNILQSCPSGQQFNPQSGELNQVWIGKFKEFPPNGDLNFPYFRYAEVLLMIAEAENEVNGPTQRAYDAINQVRERAGVGSLPTGLSQEEFFEAVVDERRLEFAFERKRKYDLLRWGRFVEVMQEHGDDPFTFSWGAEAVSETDRLLPIPQVALDQNDELEQNPGY